MPKPKPDWVITREGEGEDSVIHARSTRRAVAWRMSQAEARALVSDLSHVVLMPPRSGI